MKDRVNYAEEMEKKAQELRRREMEEIRECITKDRCLDFIVDQGLNYLEGNVVKYVARHRYKNGLQDLLKANQYIDKLIETERNKEAIRNMQEISKGE